MLSNDFLVLTLTIIFILCQWPFFHIIKLNSILVLFNSCYYYSGVDDDCGDGDDDYDDDDDYYYYGYRRYYSRLSCVETDSTKTKHQTQGTMRHHHRRWRHDSHFDGGVDDGGGCSLDGAYAFAGVVDNVVDGVGSVVVVWLSVGQPVLLVKHRWIFYLDGMTKDKVKTWHYVIKIMINNFLYLIINIWIYQCHIEK